MPFLKLDRGDIYYEISGEAKQKENSPIIILKPLSRGPIGVQPFIDILAIKNPVINYDQRGLGKSPSSPFISPVPLSERAKEVFELLDGLSINSAHIVCHSTGCGIGLSMIKSDHWDPGTEVCVHTNKSTSQAGYVCNLPFSD